MTGEPATRQPTPWGQLIRDARGAKFLSIPEAARLAGVSEVHWGHIERGYQSGGKGKPVIPRSGTADTIAHMADVTGVGPERLEAAGRPDAARVLREIRAQRAETPSDPRLADPLLRQIAEDERLDEEVRAGLIALVEGMLRSRRQPA